MFDDSSRLHTGPSQRLLPGGEHGSVISPLRRLSGVDFTCGDPWSSTRLARDELSLEALTLGGSNGASRKSAATWSSVPKVPRVTSLFLLATLCKAHDRKLCVFVDLFATPSFFGFVQIQ